VGDHVNGRRWKVGELAAATGVTVRTLHHFDEVERHFQSRQRLRRRLVALLAAARDTAEPSIDELIEAMEAMMQASYFTPDQLARLKERHREAGAGGFARWQQEWTAIVGELRAHLDRGADVAEPAVQETARRWTALMAHMTGGDPEILSAMYASLDGKGPESATRGVVTSDVWEYVKRAFAVGFGAA
jgi:DNA-binding transcriptional MerR regulator